MDKKTMKKKIVFWGIVGVSAFVMALILKVFGNSLEEGARIFYLSHIDSYYNYSGAYESKMQVVSIVLYIRYVMYGISIAACGMITFRILKYLAKYWIDKE